jgi:hypothetical protein
VIQPSTRNAGSSHILRFNGVLVLQAAPLPQTINGELAKKAGPLLGGVTLPVRFALADMTDLADGTTRLPTVVYDDSVPAGASPHSNTATMGPDAGGAGTPAGKTYAQNVRVRAEEYAVGNPFVPGIVSFGELSPLITLDGPAGSGLGLEQNTGVPVVEILITLNAAGVAALTVGLPPPGLGIIVEVEVPHTIGR